MTYEPRLPHDARGLDLGEIAFEVRPDGKVILFPKNRAEPHLTFHPGNASGVLDLHRTFILQDGTRRHETVFAMRRDDLPHLLAELMPQAMSALGGLIRPLRLGWLKHRNIGVVRGLAPPGGALASVTRLNRRKRLEFDHVALAKTIVAPDYLEALFDEPDGTVFNLLDMTRGRGKQIGVAIKVPRTDGVGRLAWIKFADVSRAIERLNKVLPAIVGKYALPRLV